ncbi:coiled-coil domain-containing glutamate-rich protein 1 [Sceloporus undulatus]|uniref:coiled-coil domain-containing glutamate-rich protein 1 n=1 Tax=Sceloporus undulatus TaxID=8520 RepID=UPI001C4D1672|nr:coiled-coil domain-containing glutamate-rich protein 1 [Sceloporus undulatus]
MWRQGRKCYQQLSVQQGYTNQWPVMSGRTLNAGRNNSGMSHHNHYTKVYQPRSHHFSRQRNYNFSRSGRPWKRKGGYWKRKRSYKKKQTNHSSPADHQWPSRFCSNYQSHQRHYYRKRYFRRQRLLAFMHAAVKGRLRPMNLCGWRAPGMRAPRNTTQFIMHQVYEDMRLQKKEEAAAAASKRDEEKTERQFFREDDICSIVSASSSCMALISPMTPESNILTEEEDEEDGENESNWTSQRCENIDLESQVNISCEP